MKRFILFTIILLIFLSACKKDDVDPLINQLNGTSFTQLNIGNYWVYQNYSYSDSFDSEIVSPFLDTISIVRDTMVRGKIYFIFEQTNHLFNRGNQIHQIVRDSSDYLIDLNGEILFSSTNFTDTFKQEIVYHKGSDSTARRLTKMFESEIIRVPYGNVEALFFSEGLYFDKVINNVIAQYYYSHYTAGIGKAKYPLKETLNERYYFRRLVKFKVK